MHPSLERLDAFGRGDVPEHEAATIEDHLAACPDCLARLAGASRDDVLLGLVRAAGREALGDSPGQVDANRLIPPDVPTGYEILGPLGRGGMGVVYRASQRALGRVVALKMIQAGLDADEHELARFQTEAGAAARLRHPNIVQVYDVGLRDGLPFFAMELVEGGGLADRLRKGPLRPREAAGLVCSIARALHHAHELGVVHRDVKPGNILLAADGTPKLADFGLAKRLDATGGQTQTGVLLGTPGYMAPEQAEGHAVGPAADIYALGAVLYECLTGRPPFQAATVLETLEQVRSCDPPPPSRLQPGIPRDAQTICLKCLEKDPRRRYATAAALADDLDHFLRNEPITARPISATGRMLKWARRRPSAAALTALGVATVIGGFAGLLAHQARLRVEIGNTRKAANEARAQRALADTNYREARGAIREILGHVQDPKYVGIPLAADLQKAQAESALGFYERVLAASDSPDPAVQLDTVVALREAANLQITLGRFEPAEANLKRAARLLDALAVGRQHDVILTRERMAVHVKLGVMFMDRDTARALEALETARKYAGDLMRIEDRSWQSRADLAWCEDNIGSALLIANRAAESEPHHLQATELRRALVREHPDDLGARVELAGTLVNLGQIQVGKRPDLAEASFAEAAGFLDKAHESNPHNLTYTLYLAKMLNNWGNLASRRGQRELALERWGRGLSLVEPILLRQPSHSDVRYAALNLHGARANLLGDQGRHAEAVADWDQVVALNDGPANEMAYRQLRLFALLKAGNHKRSIDEIERLADPAPGGPPHDGAALYNFACFYALASAAAGRDATLPAEQRTPLASAHAERALDWLRRAAESGFLADPANRDHARVDSDLEAIRGRPEFQRILEATSPPRQPGPSRP